MTDNEKRMRDEKLTETTLEKVDGGVGEEYPFYPMYETVQGDTLSLIAERHHTTVQALQSANPDLVGENGPIAPGRLLKIL